jgi:hypothetical protein
MITPPHRSPAASAPTLAPAELPRRSRRHAVWPPYALFEQSVEERARARLDKLERLYHVGQDNAWDGREVLAALIAKHGPPRLPPAKRPAALKLLSVLLWGELAAWAISADLAERIEDVEAKMAATSQAHDEARHFYVLRDYLRATGEEVPRLGGLSRLLLTKILDTDDLVHKLVGMQLLVESNALGLFHGFVDGRIEPVLTELLPYYERDEARHVGLGVMYLPRLLRHLSDWDVARVVAFQVQCLGLLMTAGNALRADFAALGLDQRKMAGYTMKLQADIVGTMLAEGDEGGAGRRRDAIRGLLNPGRGGQSPILDFVHPPGGVAAAPAWHQRTLAGWARAGQWLDRRFA